MSTRDEDARAFAKTLGWEYFDGGTNVAGWFERRRHPPGGDPHLMNLPAPDAPLHEHTGFLGRVAEAVGSDKQGFELFFGECLWHLPPGTRDWTWACLRAATAAKGASRG